MIRKLLLILGLNLSILLSKADAEVLEQKGDYVIILHGIADLLSIWNL